MPSKGDRHPVTESLSAWSTMLASCLGHLRQLSGSTEQDFLQVGGRLLAINQQATLLSATARQFAEIASGERIQSLMDRLQQMLDEMGNSLQQAQYRNRKSSDKLSSVLLSLRKVAEPIEDFRRLAKKLYIFEVLIKIESTYMGGMETEFMNLATDIKKLSQQIKDKTASIKKHSSELCSILNKNIIDIDGSRIDLEQSTQITIEKTASSVSKLAAVNDRFTSIGSVISAAAQEHSDHLGEIVQSMQFHDIFRQQIEHVVESLEWLQPLIEQQQASPDEPFPQELIAKIGDICELQEAQLRFAAATLYRAVESIVSHLRDIGGKQQEMGRNIFAHAELGDDSAATFISDVSEQIDAITVLLTTCTETNAGMVGIMEEVTRTVAAITAFVADIEDIGAEIIKIALNARIKAAATGAEGAALSALSEEVGLLSNEAVQRTNTITASLTEIHTTTGSLASEAENNGSALSGRLEAMHAEIEQILGLLRAMGGELTTLLPRLRQQLFTLTDSIVKVTDSITVHERSRPLAERVLIDLGAIIGEARALCPASSAFKDDLRRMAERYTMDSERQVHEQIAARHGVAAAAPKRKTEAALPEETEFGDNIELF